MQPKTLAGRQKVKKGILNYTSTTFLNSGTMSIPLLNKPLRVFPGHLKWRLLGQAFLLMFLGLNALSVKAEGSKDFVNYPGYRIFLDTRDPQQLKVYANAGEFINVGSSHVGVQGGFIVIIDPSGDTIQVYDNTGATTGLAIIQNNIEELNGPTGSANGGYNPGVITVPPDKEGVWTIVFGYPSYVNSPFTNLLNNAPWTRAANQPNTRRAVLAWDVTVSSGAPGNLGGTLHEGRLYSNEHISLINGNGVLTSPVFYVLTLDGYLYEVRFKDADPFRFPISSNSRGLVDGNLQPVYKSKAENAFARSDDPDAWDPGSLYLYEPQAEDFEGLINNKIFFNIPDPAMPKTAKVTDIFRENTHDTWLYNNLEILQVLDFYFIGADEDGLGCGPGVMQLGQGGWFVFETNLSGHVVLDLDLNNNGIFGEPRDVRLTANIEPDAGPLIVDSIFWDGKDGLGINIPIDTAFVFRYKASIRFGELHIAMTDVENNPQGVTFQWLNAPLGYADSLFYYDHSDIGGIVSGGGTPGNALPTSIPFKYSGNFGNDKYLDQWFFIENVIGPAFDTIAVVESCTCITGDAELVKVEDGGDRCEGGSITLSAVNTVDGIGDLIYKWTGPNGFSFTETIAEGDTSAIFLSNLTALNAGTYNVYAETEDGCLSEPLHFTVVVNLLPVINGFSGGGSFCLGESTTLSAANIALGITTIDYIWTFPNGSTETGTVAGNANIQLSLPNLTETQAGTYTLVLSSEHGCVSETFSVDVTVNAIPVLTALSGTGAYCLDDNLSLKAVNSTGGITTMICYWTGPNGFNTTQTVTGTDTVSLDLTNVNPSFSGSYEVYCVSNSCASNSVLFNIIVTQAPEINAISADNSYCAGTDVTLTAQNNQPGTGEITYTWIGPNPNNPLFPFTATVPADASGNNFGPFPVTITDFQPEDTGVYTLILVAAGGCPSVPQSVNVGIRPTPSICNVPDKYDACLGQDVILSAENCTPGVEPIVYVWTNPDGSICSEGVSGNSGPFKCLIPNIQEADTGIYTLTLTSNLSGCSADPIEVEVNVFPGLNIENVTPDGYYCEGSDVVLTGNNSVTVGSLIYTWTGPDGTVHGPFTVNDDEPLTYVIHNIQLEDAGDYILQVSSEGGCVADPDTVFVGVLKGVKATCTGGGDVCSGDGIILQGTVITSADSIFWAWIGPDGDTIAIGVGVPPGPFEIIIIATGDNGGVYTFNAWTIDGCYSSVVTGVTVHETPIAHIVTQDTTACELDLLTLCGQNLNPNVGAFSYVWVAPNGQIVTGEGYGTEIFCDDFSPAIDYGEGYYVLIINAEGCTSEPDSVYIELKPNPVISIISGGGTYCEGDTAVICFINTNPEIDSFYYTCILADSTQITSIASTEDTICIDVTIGGPFIVSLESLDGCVSNLAIGNVVFLPSPDLEIDIVDTLCANEALFLSAVNNTPGSGTVVYTWTGPGGFIFSDTADWHGPFPALDPDPETGLYCIDISTFNGCADTACVEVTVNPIPEVTNLHIEGGGEYCEGEEVTLSGTVFIEGGGIVSYAWTFNGEVIGTGAAPSGTVVTHDLGAVSLDDSGEYCLELTSSEGCQSEPACTTVVVKPIPVILVATGGGEYCEGSTVPLNGSGTPGLGTVVYTWIGPDGEVVCSGTAPSEGPFPCSVPDVETNQSGDYTLVITLDDCPSVPASVKVEINPIPVVIEIEGEGEYCEGDSTTISFTIDTKGAASVDWKMTGPFSDNGTVTTTTTISYHIEVNSSTVGTYTITLVSDKGCESVPVVIVIDIKPVPAPVLTAEPNPLCPGDELQLSVEGIGEGFTFEWFKDGVSLGATSVPFFNVIDPTGGNYSVVVSSGNCSNGSAAVNVTVLGAPVAVDDSYESQPGIDVIGNVLENDQVGSGVSVSIVQQGNFGTVTIDQDGNFTYVQGSESSTTDQFIYEICLIDCPDVCDQAIVTITSLDVPCEVPNIFTPNGDGANDLLIIDCVVHNPDNSFKVFNRWGDEIYSAEPYLNDWNGTYGKDGKELPAATYFYLFKKDKKSSEVKGGYIEIVR